MMCEPQVFGLWAGSSLAKMPSDGRAGGPRLRLDTSLTPTHTQFRNPPAYGCFCYIHANLKTFELKNPLSTFKSLLISLQRRVSSSCTKPKVNENIYLKSEIFSFSKCILAYLSGGRYFS